VDLPGVGAGKMGVDANELRENKVHDFIFFFFAQYFIWLRARLLGLCS